jgi:hypothetical protein
LKRQVIENARLAGASSILSEVHFDNDAMYKLNEKLGARIATDPLAPQRNLFVVVQINH